MRQKSTDILYLCDNSGGITVSGEAESISILAKHFENVYDIAVIEPSAIDHDRFGKNVYKVVRMNRLKYVFKNPFLFVYYIVKMQKLIKKLSPRIIHTQSQVSFFIVGLLIRLRLINKKDFFLIHTDRGLYLKYSNFINNIFLYCMRYMDALVTTTQYNMNFWSDAIHKKYPNKQFWFSVIENTAGSVYEQYNSQKKKFDRFTVGFAGRYCDWKDWQLAEKICMLIHEKNLNIRFDMAIGTINNTEKNYIAEINTFINRMQRMCGNNFIGRIDHPFEEMDDYYYGVDVFVLTSKPNTESFGRTLVEAMSRKCAVLSTDSGGATEVVGNKSNILSTAEEFAEKIIHWYNSPQELNAEKENCWLYVHKHFSLHNNISKHKKLYEKFLC